MRLPRPNGDRSAAHPQLLRLLRLAFLLVAVGLSVYAVATRWDQVVLDVERIGWVRLAVCVPAMLGGLVCGMLSWRAVLAGLGSPLGRTDAARIYFVGQLGKYVPGSVWPVLAQMELGRDHDIPRRRSAGALIVAVVLSLTTGLILAGLTVPFVTGHRHPALWWLLALVPLLTPLLASRVLLGALRRLPVLDLGPALPAVLPDRRMAAAVGWSTLGWLSYGLHVAVLAGAFPSGGATPLVVASIGGYPLAWAAGMIAFMLPAGAGARDVTIVLALSAVVPTNSAIAAAVVSRAVTTACDLGLAATAAAGARAAIRAPSRRVPVTVE
ncbi:MAG TPA: lysylphosphatidylglycerol synthase transmembrane domain-containing protein [Mycobacteriales bacterium]|nr:lysylphosphatidylglycerol synthase transmembrane domain-containing protein [Mycobacteriales bacterium]